MIESLQDGVGTSADNFAVKGPATSKTVNKICGFLWNAIAGNDGTTLATACTYKTPFRVGVHFDIGEAIALGRCSFNFPQGGRGVSPVQNQS